jgi:hypothetical protein
MKQLFNLRYAQLAFLMAVLSACAAIGLPSPESFEDRLALGVGAVTQIRTDATVLLRQKAIDADDAQNAQDAANVARTGLDIARNLANVDRTAAEARLRATTAALTAMQTYLATRKK